MYWNQFCKEQITQLLAKQLMTRCYDKNFSEKFGEKSAFLTQNTASFCRK
jgi:hypothetical protein